MPATRHAANHLPSQMVLDYTPGNRKSSISPGDPWVRRPDELDNLLPRSWLICALLANMSLQSTACTLLSQILCTPGSKADASLNQERRYLTQYPSHAVVTNVCCCSITSPPFFISPSEAKSLRQSNHVSHTPLPPSKHHSLAHSFTIYKLNE